MIEIVVIGAGIAGVTAALELWERGAAVTVLEMSRPGAEATGASAGMLAAQYEAAEATAKFWFGIESRRRYPAFAARLEELSGQDLQVRWGGILVANLTLEEHESAVADADAQRSVGLRVDILEPRQAAHLQPGVTSRAVSYVWLPDEGWLDSQRLALALGDALARTGIRLISGHDVDALLAEHGRVTGVSMTGGRRLEADRVVLAAGAWSGTIAGLPRSLPVRPMRGQILRFPASALPLDRVVASHAGRYLVPRGDGSVLAGSTMEDVGFDRSITDDGLREVHDSAAQLVPALAGCKSMERWSGLRPVSADSQPVLGPDPDMEGLLYATGYGRAGILLAPLAGTIVADLAIGGSSEIDWRPFRPDRFDQ